MFVSDPVELRRHVLRDETDRSSNATKQIDHPRGTAPGRAGQLVEETWARPRPASLAFRQMTRAST